VWQRSRAASGAGRRARDSEGRRGGPDLASQPSGLLLDRVSPVFDPKSPCDQFAEPGRIPVIRPRRHRRRRPLSLPAPHQPRAWVARPVRDGGLPPPQWVRRLIGLAIGTRCHQPPPTSTGRYSVEQPHQSGISRVSGGHHPSRWRSLARNRIGATSRPQVQQASVGRRRPWASSQVGGVMALGLPVSVGPWKTLR
jgi:hypothetical protein